MKKNILLSILMIFSLGLQAQQASIQGVLLSAESREPIMSAVISLPGQQKFAVSSEQGTFELKGLQAGPVNIKVEHVAYKNLQRPIHLSSGENSLEILMEEELVFSEEIVVSAGFFTGRDQTAYKVETVKAEEIARSGTHNMMEALSFVPGVSQISYGPAVGKPVIRGLSFSRIMTVYQGIRIENQQWGEDHGLGLNDQGISRVEVVKGPASLMYGSGAIGGVINIVDQEPAEKPLEGYAGIDMYSNTLGMRSDLGLKGIGNSGLFWSLDGNVQSHSDYRDGNNRIVGNSRFSSAMAKTAAGIKKGWGSSKLTYTYQKQLPGIIEEHEMQETMATNRWDKSLQVPYQHITDHLLTSQSVFNIGASKLRLNLGHHLNLREENEEAMGKIDLGLRLQTSTYDLKYNFFLTPQLEFISGFQGFYQTNTNMEEAGEILLPDSRQWDNGIYGLLMYDLGSLNLQGGLRYDHRQTIADATRLEGFELAGTPASRRLERSFSGYTGSLGATYKFNKHLLLRSNLASGFRAPDLAELFSNGEHPGTNRFERGNAGFGREQNLEWDLSALYRQDNFSFEVAGYYNYIQNYIFFSPTDERMGEQLWIWQFEQDHVQLWGGEAGLSWSPITLPWLENKLSFSMVRGERLSTGNSLPLIPADRLMNELRLQRETLGAIKVPYVMLRVQHVFSQHRTGRFEQPTDRYTLSSLGAGGNVAWRGRELNLNLMVQNLFNVAYMDHMAVTRPFGVRNMGRNVTLGVKVSF
jgi:iron complex outermembrane receptor protein